MPKLNKKSIQRFLQSDRAILLLCISMALVFWLLTKLSKSFTTTREFQIEYNMPTDLAYSEMPPTSLVVRISGEGWDLLFDYLESSDEALIFNLSREYEQTLFSDQIRNRVAERLTTSDIDINTLYPDNITVQLEQKATKKVPLLLNAALVYKSDFYQKDSIQLTPDSVSISGPVSLVDSIHFWETALVKKEAIDRDIRAIVALQKSPNPVIFLAQQDAKLDIAVEQQTEKSIFVPLQIKNEQDSLRIFPKTTKITFIVGFSQFDAVNSDAFQAEVDFTQVQKNSTNNTLPIHLAKSPSFVRNIQLNPKSVEFYILK